MQRLTLSWFTIVVFFAQGLNLPTKKRLIFASCDISLFQTSSRQIFANLSAKGTHRLDVDDIEKTPIRRNAAGSQVHPPNSTVEPVSLQIRFRSAFTLERVSLSHGIIIVGLVICGCFLLSCLTIIDESHDETDPPLIGQSGGAVTLHNQGAGFESPPLAIAATPPGAVGHGYDDVQTVGFGYSGAQSQRASGMSSPSREASLSNYMAVARGSGSQAVYPNLPDPICPELVLVVESWYAVDFESIGHAAGPIPIYGRGKKLLLTAQIQFSGGHRSLTLTMGDGRGPILGSTSMSGTSLLIYDKRKRFYGELIRGGNLVYSLRCGGVEKVRFDTHARPGAVTLLNPHDGTHLASAAKTKDVSQVASLSDHLGISVVAGMDPALTILCIISLMALTD